MSKSEDDNVLWKALADAMKNKPEAFRLIIKQALMEAIEDWKKKNNLDDTQSKESKK